MADAKSDRRVPREVPEEAPAEMLAVVQEVPKAEPQPEAKAEPELPTVEQCFARSVVEMPPETATRPGIERRMARAAHEAAATFHGWREHEHHEAAPIRMSFDDYRAALAAADKCSEPHKQALSPHHPIFGRKADR